MSETAENGKSSWLKPSLNWLLVFVPVTMVMARVLHTDPTIIFIMACLAIIPLAGLMGHATEALAEKAGAGLGGFLNATFGNAAELIIAFVALKNGMHEVVKASITGSIIGNVLLVLGLSILAGGFKRERQKFNTTAASSGATHLLLAAVALILPAVFHHLTADSPSQAASEEGLSVEISIVLLVTYAASLLFSLRTHKHLYDGGYGEESQAQDHHGPHWSTGKAVTILAVATAMVAVMSEILVHAVEHASKAMGLTEVFVGVIVVAIIGNAAEHSSAILLAMKDKMDVAVGIAVGSSIQIAQFVAPVLVLASMFMPKHMNLVFTPAEVLAVVVSVLIVGQISQDGESNWMEGVQLLAVYVIIALVFYNLPAPAPVPGGVPAPGGH